MARRYAANTTVPVERTQAEINRLLGGHGANTRAVGADDTSSRGVIMFELGGRRIRHEVPLPNLTSITSRPPPRGWSRWQDARRRKWVADELAQELRSSWRGLLLLLRAKLEAVESGATTIEREFLADIMLPSGHTVGSTIKAGIETAYLTGTVPPLLPSASPSNGSQVAT